ncbi:ExbD/TolR family protein [Flavobacterium sp. W22_SRS_FK3]|uniref:ExbD/TolR family protein n=1 Tax=Flavobacterium sp. W22_SRS_FK3 TaxID=3240275 RepID=UPI003F8F55F8
MENLPKKVRSKKLNARVDLTAIVSVSFLLIIFFMVATELAKPKIMALSLPEKDPVWDGVIRCGAGIDYRVITVLLDDKDKIITYSGLLGYSDKLPKEFKYGADGIRKELINKKNKIQKYSGDSNRGPIVIIKPSKKCNFKNLVDILDEMAISKIETYAIVNEFTPEETKLLAAN